MVVPTAPPKGLAAPAVIVKTVPPGSMVIVGQALPPCRCPQLRFWLAVIVRMTCGCAAVRVPDVPGDTLMVPPGSPESEHRPVDRAARRAQEQQRAPASRHEKR